MPDAEFVSLSKQDIANSLNTRNSCFFHSFLNSNKSWALFRTHKKNFLSPLLERRVPLGFCSVSLVEGSRGRTTRNRSRDTVERRRSGLVKSGAGNLPPQASTTATAPAPRISSSPPQPSPVEHSARAQAVGALGFEPQRTGGLRPPPAAATRRGAFLIWAHPELQLR